MQKEEAQRHVDRMQAFREELEQLETEGILCLSSEERHGSIRIIGPDWPS